MRIGHGYDVHRLAEGRKLVLGGVTINHHLGLLGHSDADVVLHAVCDAILGALGRGDIGQHFPDNDARFKDIDSRVLVREVAQFMLNEERAIGNLDITIVAQAPKLAPHLPVMQKNLADDLGCAAQRVNIKATTTETLGFEGQQLGIAAHAVVLLEPQDS